MFTSNGDTGIVLVGMIFFRYNSFFCCFIDLFIFRSERLSTSSQKVLNIPILLIFWRPFVSRYFRLLLLFFLPLNPFPLSSFSLFFLLQDGVPLRRNQKLVLKMLLEKQTDALVLFKDSDGIEQRNSLIKSEDYLNPNSLLFFHMKQIDLITTCAKGLFYIYENNKIVKKKIMKNDSYFSS